MQPISRELDSMNYINSLLNQHQVSSLQEIHNHAQPQISPSNHSDPTSSQEDFLEQLMSSVPSSAWYGLNSQAVENDVGDDPLFTSANPANDASVKALFNGFTGSLGQTPNQPQHFHQSQAQNFGHPLPDATPAPAVTQPAASGSGGGQTRQRVRARRGQATDPHSIAERLRRERIAERMKGLQELVPNANKTDKASMLDEIIDYVKFLQLQVKVLSMSRLGGASAVAPLVADMSSEGRNGNGTQTASSSNNDGLTVTENQLAKLMQEDMGSAMQYLQGKGLCLMPISLATAISTTTSRSRNPQLNGDPNSPNMSVLTVQSAVHKDSTSVSKP